MKLFSPFAISARLAPALQIGAAWLSYDAESAQFVIDLPDGLEHAFMVNLPRCRVRGVNDTPETLLQSQFAAALSFLGACAESRAYAVRSGEDASEGENSDLFPANVGEWAESVSDELAILTCELEESGSCILPDGMPEGMQDDGLPDDSDPQDPRTHSLAYREAHAREQDDTPRADSAEDLA